MIVVYSNDTWTLLIANDATTAVTCTGNITRPATNPHRWITESAAPCSPPDYHKPYAQWNAEKKRRELEGIKAAQRKHERIKLSACKTARKVLKYYREPRFNAVNVKMEVER